MALPDSWYLLSIGATRVLRAPAHRSAAAFFRLSRGTEAGTRARVDDHGARGDDSTMGRINGAATGQGCDSDEECQQGFHMPVPEIVVVDKALRGGGVRTKA